MFQKFKENSLLTLELISQRSSIETNTNKKVFGVIITPWLYTNVPFYSLLLGKILGDKGHEIVYIFDDFDFFGDEEQNKILYEVYEGISSSYQKILLSEFLNENVIDSDCEKYIELNERLINRKYSDTEYGYAKVYFKKSSNAYFNVLKDRFLDKIIIPGGIYKNTCLLRNVCEHLKIEYVTYDSGQGEMLLGKNSVAAHRNNVEIAYNRFEDMEKTGFSSEKIIEISKKEINARKKGEDYFAYLKGYIANFQENKQKIVLLPLNIFNDAAAVDIECCFLNVKEWLITTIDFLLKNTDYKIIIRDHPGSMGSYNNNKLIQDLYIQFQDALLKKDLEIIDSKNKINTYDLLEMVDLVLPYSSTVGIEAAIFGKKVVVCTDVYYKNNNFVKVALDREHYFQSILNSLDSNKNMERIQINALKYYYFSQVLGFLKTEFTPQPIDFKANIDNLNKIIEETNVKILIEAIENSDSIEWLLFKYELEGGGLQL